MPVVTLLGVALLLILDEFELCQLGNVSPEDPYIYITVVIEMRHTFCATFNHTLYRSFIGKKIISPSSWQGQSILLTEFGIAYCRLENYQAMLW